MRLALGTGCTNDGDSPICGVLNQRFDQRRLSDSRAAPDQQRRPRLGCVIHELNERRQLRLAPDQAGMTRVLGMQRFRVPLGRQGRLDEQPGRAAGRDGLDVHLSPLRRAA